MAAIRAADAGIKATVLESMPKPARKLGISGKGRGNLTNIAPYKDFLKHFNNHGRFLKFCFKQFFNQDLLHFFSCEGLKTITERGGRVFPASGKATEIVGVLVEAAKKRGVKILVDTGVKVIIKQHDEFIIKTTSDEKITARTVIIATGGKSYPLTGSTGDGFRFAAMFGHQITTPTPSLVALKAKEEIPPGLERLLLKNVAVQLRVNGKKVAGENGEMTFIDGCLAGAVVVTLSRIAVPLIQKEEEVSLCIDLKPALDHEKLDRRLLRDLEQLQREPLHQLLRGLLPAPMVEFCASSLNFDLKSPCANFSAESRRKLRNWLKELCFVIAEPGPWSQAIVTAGGVNTGEISMQTMESKLVKNLYFAGEVIDIDADTGGYNLQAAFSTGWLAGASAAERLRQTNEA